MQRQVLSICILLSLCFPAISFGQDQFIMVPDSMMEFPSVEKILERPEFENKVVLVDWWYTSCGPCIKEFAHIDKLKERFEQEQLAFLYICVPITLEWRKEYEMKWEEMVGEYQLYGTNFLVGEEFTENFWTRFLELNPNLERYQYAYPTYLLVDKDKKIVDYHAPRPSSGEKLYERIDKLLK